MRPTFALLMTGYALAGIGAIITILTFLRYLRTRQRTPIEGRRCLCGYPTKGLEIPRCPECGRMIGFNKSPEELGITEEQMRAEAEKRRATRGSANIP